MKTITIPKRFGYPTLDITVNGKVYTVKSGEEITIEDNIAEAIENAIALEPKHKRYLSRIASLVYKSITEVTDAELDGLPSIGDYAFYNCTKLASITIPNSVSRIGNQAFAYCTALESAVIPDSVTYFGERLFYNSTALKKVTLRATTPPTIKTDTFSNVPTTCVFEVPSEAVEAYKVAQYWSAIANQIVAIKE